jgi:uncharacterized protein involved in type VI secretion and phage assembly
VAVGGAQGAPGEPARPPFHLDGIVHEAGVDSVPAGCVVYALMVRPGFSALAYRTDCRVFLDQSRVDVVKAIFEEAGRDESLSIGCARRTNRGR